MAEVEAASLKHEYRDPREAIVCTLCVDRLKDPVTLDCYHHLCKICLDNETQGADNGSIECPVCHYVTETQNQQANPLLLRIIDWYQRDKNGERQCGYCLKGKASWICMDCDTDLCDDCHNGHLRVRLLRSHRLVSLKDDSGVVLDGVVFCGKHEDKAIEMNCGECEETMCVECKCSNHSTHAKTETVQSALERIHPTLKENLAYMDKVIGFKQQAVEYIRKSMEDMKMEYAQTREAIGEQKKDVLNYLEDRFNKLIEQVNQSEQEEKERLQQVKIAEENSVKYIEGLKAWVKTLLQTTKGVALLQEYQLDCKMKIEQLLLDIKKNSHVQVVRRCPSFKAASELPSEEVMLGRLSFTSSVPIHIDVGGRGEINKETIPNNQLQVHLPTLAGQKWMKKSEFQVQQANKFRLLSDNSFILPNSSGLSIYSQSGQVLKQIQCKEIINNFQCIIQIANEFIVGGSSGLFCINTDGTFQYKISNGHCVAITSHGDEIYVLEYNGSQVCKVTVEDGQWKIQHLFYYHQFNKSQNDTLIATENDVYICSYNKDNIFKYNKTGTLINSYGEKRKGGSPGLIYSAYLSTRDLDSNMLMTDSGNNRLQILESHGSWEAIMLPDLLSPQDVVVENESTLWCLCGSGYKIIKYVSVQ